MQQNFERPDLSPRQYTQCLRVDCPAFTQTFLNDSCQLHGVLRGTPRFEGRRCHGTELYAKLYRALVWTIREGFHQFGCYCRQHPGLTHLHLTNAIVWPEPKLQASRVERPTAVHALLLLECAHEELALVRGQQKSVTHVGRRAILIPSDMFA
eukprot:3035829-Pyramimonas_sp.AAC.1